MRDESKSLLKGRFKVYVCPNVLFVCYISHQLSAFRKHGYGETLATPCFIDC